MKKIVPIILLIILITTISIFVINNKKKPNELTAYGNIEIRQVDLSFQVSGQISKMLKEEGDSVQKGELLAILDDKDYKSNLAKANAEVARTLAIKNDANSQYIRKQPLSEDNTISKMEYDTLLNNKNKTESDYKAALANKQFIQNQLDYTKVYAPDDGIITVRAQEPGATINKGQIIYTMAKNKPVWIRAYINEEDLGNIKYGMPVKVYTDTTNPETGKLREYIGQIGYISPVAEFTPKTVQTTDLRTNLVYRIRVYVDNIDEYLRQGMPVTIKINLDNINNNANSKYQKFD